MTPLAIVISVVIFWASCSVMAMVGLREDWLADGFPDTDGMVSFIYWFSLSGPTAFALALALTIIRAYSYVRRRKDKV